MSTETTGSAGKGTAGQEGADIRRRLYIFTAILIVVFLIVIALGFLV